MVLAEDSCNGSDVEICEGYCCFQDGFLHKLWWLWWWLSVKVIATARKYGPIIVLAMATMMVPTMDWVLDSARAVVVAFWMSAAMDEKLVMMLAMASVLVPKTSWQ